MIGFKTELAKENWDRPSSQHPFPSGQSLPEPDILFRKVEDEEIEEQIAKLGAKSKKAPMTTQTATLNQPSPSTDFDKLDLRVGQVLEAAPVPKSKKLLKLLVDLGSEKRTIVSGIALTYEPEQLIGKKFIVVANLAPATLMGIESQGMILAAHSGAELELPEIQRLAPGSLVT